jgi:hypothetical protein
VKGGIGSPSGSPERSASISTESVFAATAAGTWDATVFYEDIEHPSPWLLRLVLPRPVRSEGPKDVVGSVVRCTYEAGHLLKRITEVEPARRLAFDVIEQELRFGRGIRLLGGVVAIDPLGEATTRVTLTTRYVSPLLRPERLWLAVEARVVHAFHRHMLEGMRRRVAPPIRAATSSVVV